MAGLFGKYEGGWEKLEGEGAVAAKGWAADARAWTTGQAEGRLGRQP